VAVELSSDGPRTDLLYSHFKLSLKSEGVFIGQWDHI